MGMTDKQFNGYLRLLLDSLETVRDETDAEKKEAGLHRLIQHIRDTIED